MGLGWYSPIERLRKLVRVEGLEHLERAKETGQGIIVLCAHFTSLETSTSTLGELFPGLKTVHRPQPNEMIDAMIYQGRSRLSEQQIPKDNIRVMVRALRDNGSVAYLADLANRSSNSELIPFFGEPAMTMTTVSKLAKMTGATVLTYFFRRLPGKAGYVANIGAPLHDFPTDDVVADTRRLVERLEDYIRLAPEQYMWTYRRFKGRPEPLPDIYRADS
jgi:KDO2-lipid IV(A) lauroyltransferase